MNKKEKQEAIRKIEEGLKKLRGKKAEDVFPSLQREGPCGGCDLVSLPIIRKPLQ